MVEIIEADEYYGRFDAIGSVSVKKLEVLENC
jgi:hypothetical protein